MSFWMTDWFVQGWRQLQQQFGVHVEESFAKKNVFAVPVWQQLMTVWKANLEEKWGIPPEMFVRLLLTAPAWPDGRLAFRSLRIRFGNGEHGVGWTFRAHMKRVLSVYYPNFFRADSIQSGHNALSLEQGNHTHKATVEWIVFSAEDHQACRPLRECVSSTSFADEVLVFLWMFPSYVFVMDGDQFPFLCASNYVFSSSQNGSFSFYARRSIPDQRLELVPMPPRH